MEALFLAAVERLAGVVVRLVAEQRVAVAAGERQVGVEAEHQVAMLLPNQNLLAHDSTKGMTNRSRFSHIAIPMAGWCGKINTGILFLT